jgi:hypothetical protein
MSQVTVADVSPAAIFTLAGASAGPPGRSLLQPDRQISRTTQMFLEVKKFISLDAE